MEAREKQMVGTANEAGIAEEAALWYQSREIRAMLGKVWESMSLQAGSWQRGARAICCCAPLPSSFYLPSTAGTLWATTQLLTGFSVAS